MEKVARSIGVLTTKPIKVVEEFSKTKKIIVDEPFDFEGKTRSILHSYLYWRNSHRQRLLKPFEDLLKEKDILNSVNLAWYLNGIFSIRVFIYSKNVTEDNHFILASAGATSLADIGEAQYVYPDIYFSDRNNPQTEIERIFDNVDANAPIDRIVAQIQKQTPILTADIVNGIKSLIPDYPELSQLYNLVRNSVIQRLSSIATELLNTKPGHIYATFGDPKKTSNQIALCQTSTTFDLLRPGGIFKLISLTDGAQHQTRDLDRLTAYNTDLFRRIKDSPPGELIRILTDSPRKDDALISKLEIRLPLLPYNDY
jgi:hypothetical protein